MKKEYNMTLIYYIRVLKEQKIIKSWSEGVKIYYDLGHQQITMDMLTRRCKNVLFDEIDPYEFLNYLPYTKQLIKKEEVTSEKIELSNTNAIIKTLAIPQKDYKPIFDIDIEKDSNEEIIQKIRLKINDEKFLLEYLGYNPGLYEITEFNIGAWSTTLKLENEKGKYPKTIMNDRFGIKIKKRVKPILFYTKEECEQFLKDFFSKRYITPLDIFNNKEKENDQLLNKHTLMVCPGLELHLGKLASIADFEDYSTKQAMWRLRQTAKEIVRYQKYANCSNLLLGIGNDYFNSDTVDDQTTAGTQQNNDTRFKEIYLWGKIGYMQLIETLKSEFDKIIIKGNPGNHDEKTSFSLFTNLYDIYTLMGDPKVKVDMSYEDMHYTTCYKHGKNLIVFTHGKNPNGKNLTDKSIAESIKYLFPKETHEAHNIYVFVGHLHQDSETKFDNITVIRTASLTGIDDWHASNNFLGQRQGHSVYLIDEEKGYIGKHNITIGDSEKQKKISSISRTNNVEVPDEMRKVLNLNNSQMNEEIQKERLNFLTKEIDDYDKVITKIAQKIIDKKLSPNEIKNEIYNLLDENIEIAKVKRYKKMIEDVSKN